MEQLYLQNAALPAMKLSMLAAGLMDLAGPESPMSLRLGGNYVAPERREAAVDVLFASVARSAQLQRRSLLDRPQATAAWCSNKFSATCAALLTSMGSFGFDGREHVAASTE
jgi:hypothetical protein